jgi:hypothetical protein
MHSALCTEGTAMGDLRMDHAFATCEAIAEDRALATSSGAFADGYRAAAADIARAIRAKADGRERTPLARDLRDAEVEARTLARVVAAAANVVRERRGDERAADAVREVLQCFFERLDLPADLRVREPRESTTRLSLPGVANDDRAEHG